MVRSGLGLIALVGAACSIPNPLFEVYEGQTGQGTASTGGQMGSGSVGPTSGSDTDTATDTVDPTVAMSSGPVGVCGDSIVDPGETCDDGNVIGGDECPANCMSGSCGDGVADVDGGEECDDGNEVDDDMCTGACRLPACGDGVVQGMEGCDDGNGDDSDDCPGSCQPAVCGDHYTNTGEEVCDDGVDNGNYGQCNLDCSHVRKCGDGITDEEEGCDDKNDVDDDGCTKCVPDSCGDGVVDGGEECDDKNDVDDDECTNKCKEPACGDGVLQGKEECDDGNLESSDDCTEKCLKATCGDGYIWAEKEVCDDGNLLDTDSCLSTCKPAFCGDGFVAPGEQCDDGNNNDDDGCSSLCVQEAMMAVCGDGMIGPDEECDPQHGAYQKLGAAVCSEACKLKACFKVHNDKLELQEEPELKSIEWLTPCVDAPGSTVVVLLIDDNKNIVYAAKGNRGGEDWFKDNITMGFVKASLEYDLANHLRTVMMTRVVPDDNKKDILMLTSQVAAQKAQPLCFTSLGDGYGVAIFPDSKPNHDPRLLVMPVLGPNTGVPRSIVNFKGNTEISFNGANASMSVCGDGVVGFSGTFYLVVL